MADILTTTSDSGIDPASRRAAMLADWQSGMRQVDIAAKHRCSQGTVSKLIGGSPRQRVEPEAAEWRARAMLALALLNHRATEAGLSTADVWLYAALCSASGIRR